jgi:putative nucleotidyltransferase with HDIG domain
MRPESVEDAQLLLSELRAPDRLRVHGELVLEAGEMLLVALSAICLDLDASLVRAGCLLHDVGKAAHPHELVGAGHDHEATGERALLAANVDPRVARMCRSHAQWRNMACSLEELAVAVSDTVWKGKRALALEGLFVDAIVETTGRDRWEVFVAVDDICERIAEGGAERLERSA